MAKTKKSASQKSGNELLENPDALAEQLTKTEEFVEKNRNIIFGLGGFIALIVAGFIIFKYYTSTQNETAQRELFQAVYYFEADSLGKALNGDGNSYGFIEIIDSYSLTDAANLAKYYAGATYIKLGDPESAIRYLSDFSADDYLVQSRAYALIGDAHVSLDQYSDAISFYNKAINHYPNKEFTPIYLMKAAITYEENGQIDEALEAWTTITEEYFEAAEYQEAVKHKARLEGLQVD